MPGNNGSSGDELTALIQEIQERVRNRRPQGSESAANLPLVELTPLLHARDAAEAKIAAIGTVNPRPPGLSNRAIQWIKRKIARALDWYVRDQVLYNQALVNCVQATLDALNQTNHVTMALGERLKNLEERLDQRNSEANAFRAEFEDIRAHWSQWRQGWEKRLSDNEIHFLRSVADLQSSYQYRLAVSENTFRDAVAKQHGDFTAEIGRSAETIQERMWKEMAAVRKEQDRVILEHERMIHNELRQVRRRMGTEQSSASAPLSETLDYGTFAERFRGTEEYVRRGQEAYKNDFAGCRNVVDLGCGRGEFLETMRDLGVNATGVEMSAENVALCQQKSLDVVREDLFAYLTASGRESTDGILLSQVVEHLPPERVPELVKLASEALQHGGLIVIETPNPECLAIFATHFYLDPTHTRPVPSGLLAHYLQEYGFHRIEVRKLSPAVESMPSLAELPAGFHQAFFGELDYAIVARKL